MNRVDTNPIVLRPQPRQHARVPGLPAPGSSEPARFRLLHHCEVISINGPSWRLKDRLADLTPPTQTNLTQ